jgi:ribulose-phosphate 3-epimerase
MKEPAIVASVLGADYAMLGQEVAELEAAGVDRIQWDIMDGQCVPDLSFGAGAGCDTVLVRVEACRIEVDGGISATTAPGAVRAGAQLLVAGSAILAHPQRRPAAVAELRRSLQPDLQAPPDGRPELESGTHATGGIHGNPKDG